MQLHWSKTNAIATSGATNCTLRTKESLIVNSFEAQNTVKCAISQNPSKKGLFLNYAPSLNRNYSTLLGGPKFQILEILMGHYKLLFFGSKATHKKNFYENRTSFRYVYLRSKFYYILRQCAPI